MKYIKKSYNKIFLIFRNRHKWIKRKYKEKFKNKFRRRIEKREKILWKDPNVLRTIEQRLFASDPIEKWKEMDHWQRLLENKLNAKEFAKKFDCKVAKLYWTGGENEFIQFSFSTLPDNFIIKPVIGQSSQGVFLMKDGFNLFDEKKYSNEELRAAITGLFQENPGLKLIIEEFLPNEEGKFEIPNDYRLYMFNGHLLFIRLDKRRKLKRERVSFYTFDWTLIDRKILEFADVIHTDPPPSHLNEMIENARKLSEQYETFVRLDFYDSLDGAVFGEFTSIPRQGKGFTTYGSRRLIEAWDEYCKDDI